MICIRTCRRRRNDARGSRRPRRELSPVRGPTKRIATRTPRSSSRRDGALQVWRVDGTHVTVYAPARGAASRRPGPDSGPTNDEPAAKKPPGKGLVEKRARILRCLEAHVRYLATVDSMAPWQPAAFGHEPRPRQTPEEWAAHWERYAPPRYVYPRETPDARASMPGAEGCAEEAGQGVGRGRRLRPRGLAPTTQRAMAWIASFEPKKETVS